MCPWEVGNCQSLFYSLESESHLEPEFANFPTRLPASKAQRGSSLHCSPLPSPHHAGVSICTGPFLAFYIGTVGNRTQILMSVL